MRKKIFIGVIFLMCCVIIVCSAEIVKTIKVNKVPDQVDIEIKDINNPTYIIELINEERIKAKLWPLTANKKLTVAANLKMEDMRSVGYFAHVSPIGEVPWHWIKLAGYVYRSAGENLAWSNESAETVVTAWMNSPKHKANILDRRFFETGIAVGEYKGRMLIVQEFGGGY